MDTGVHHFGTQPQHLRGNPLIAPFHIVDHRSWCSESLHSEQLQRNILSSLNG